MTNIQEIINSKEYIRKQEEIQRRLAQDNIPFVVEIIEMVKADEKRNAVLEKALMRNFYLTSSYDLPHGKFTIYKEGWYLELSGTRCGYSVFVKDNDGEMELTRKPNADKLHKLYEVEYNDMWRVYEF